MSRGYIFTIHNFSNVFNAVSLSIFLSKLGWFVSKLGWLERSSVGRASWWKLRWTWASQRPWQQRTPTMFWAALTGVSGLWQWLCTLLSTSWTVSGVLCPVLGHPIQKGCWSAGANSAKSLRNGQLLEPWKERLREWGLSSLGNRRLQENLTAPCQNLWGVPGKAETGSSQWCVVGRQQT